MSVLRIYDPAECNAQGVPLDWKRCTCCDGSGDLGAGDVNPPGAPEYIECPACEGHGSLKAAALASLRERGAPMSVAEAWDKPMGQEMLDALRWRADQRVVNHEGEQVWLKRHESGEGITDCCNVGYPCERHAGLAPVRCEGCGHRMGDGSWANEDDDRACLRSGREVLMQQALRDLRGGREPFAGMGDPPMPVHYSPCDDGCRHGGPMRYRDILGEYEHLNPSGPVFGQKAGGLEASWRAVDVRTLGWPHDLRPERLAVLCLRCYAARAAEDSPELFPLSSPGPTPSTP